MGGPEPYVVVIGGANIDVKARSSSPAVRRTSNPGTAVLGSGGVGRNIAENLARLGTTTHLVAAVGGDPLGDQLVRSTAAAGVGVEHVARVDVPTGSYTAILDADGELLVAIASMAATEALGAGGGRGGVRPDRRRGPAGPGRQPRRPGAGGGPRGRRRRTGDPRPGQRAEGGTAARAG